MKFKKIGLTIAILNIVTYHSFSQSANVGIGYNIGIHSKVAGLEYVVGRYNETRPWLSTQMESPRFFQGMSYSMEFYAAKRLLSFEWTGRRSDVRANGTNSNGNQTRELRYRINSWTMGFGKKMGKRKFGAKGSYYGLDLSMIILKDATRTYSEGQHIPAFEPIGNSEINLGFSPFLQKVGKRFTLKVYYQMMLLKNDYWDTNMAINSATWSRDPLDKLKGKTSSLGICLRYNLVKND
jgi:hypothetical protein